jgi:hypothetical protein
MMHSQTERARAQIEVIRPRSWKPAKKAKQTSGLTTDQEDISAEVEDEEENTKNRYISEEEGRDEGAEVSVSDEEITISDDDNPFDLTKTSKRLAVPSCKASSQGRNKKRQKINLLPLTDDSQNHFKPNFITLAEAVTKNITPAEEKENREALEQRLTAVLEKRLGSLEQNQLAIMTML